MTDVMLHLYGYVFSRTCEHNPDTLVFLKYEMLVDKYANQRNRRPLFGLETFYGQLDRLFLIQFSPNCTYAKVEPSKPIILAAIRNCKLEKADHELESLDIHLFTRYGALDFIDVTSIQALVGRVPCDTAGADWAIIDRSGSLARAVFNAEDDIE